MCSLSVLLIFNFMFIGSFGLMEVLNFSEYKKELKWSYFPFKSGSLKNGKQTVTSTLWIKESGNYSVCLQNVVVDKNFTCVSAQHFDKGQKYITTWVKKSNNRWFQHHVVVVIGETDNGNRKVRSEKLNVNQIAFKRYLPILIVVPLLIIICCCTCCCCICKSRKKKKLNQQQQLNQHINNQTPTNV